MKVKVHSEGQYLPDLMSEQVYYVDLFAHYLSRYLFCEIEYESGRDIRFSEMEDVIIDVITVELLDGRYFVVDFRDGPGSSLISVKDENCIAAYASMYLDGIHEAKHYIEKFHPFFFFDKHPRWTRIHREEISKIKPTNDRMLFSGTIGDEKDSCYHFDGEPIRQVVRILEDKYPNIIDVLDRDEKLEREDWWRKAAQYKLSLIIPGHPWTFREHECWSLGIPTIGNTYTCPLPYPLIGNKHYVDAGTAGKTRTDREVDQEKAADLIAKRFFEVREDDKYLSLVAKEAQLRYDNYNYPETVAYRLANDIRRRIYV